MDDLVELVLIERRKTISRLLYAIADRCWNELATLQCLQAQIEGLAEETDGPRTNRFVGTMAEFETRLDRIDRVRARLRQIASELDE